MIDLGYNRPLQLAILGALWRDGRLALSQIMRAVHREYKPVAVSTVSTTLTRLVERQWVERIDRHYYQSRITRADMIAALTAAIEDA